MHGMVRNVMFKVVLSFHHCLLVSEYMMQNNLPDSIIAFRSSSQLFPICMAWFTLLSVVVVSFHVVKDLKVCLRMKPEDVAELRNGKHFLLQRSRNALIYDFPLFFL